MSTAEERSAQAKTLDGKEISLHIDPESEYPYVVGFSYFGHDSLGWACDTEQHAQALFDALQHAKLVDMD